MTSRSATSVGLRIAGVIVLVQAFLAIPSTVQIILMLRSPNNDPRGVPPGYAIALVGYVVVAIAAGLVLLLLADGIARWLVREDRQIELPVNAASTPLLLGLALRVVGVLLVTQALPALLGVPARAYLETQTLAREWDADLYRMLMTSAWVQQWTAVVEVSAKLAIGIFLALWGSSLADWLCGDRNVAPTESLTQPQSES